MNRKRDDFEYNDHDDERFAPLIKKIKSPLQVIDKYNPKNNNDGSMLVNEKQLIYENNMDIMSPNGLMKLAIISNLPPQLSSGVCHNRKRRSRVSQDMYTSNSSTDSLMPCIPPSGTNQTRRKSDLSCVVCSGLAHGYNFDAISCESCKAFFRRNALFNIERLKCRRDGACDITLETRRRCKSCRLKKCFAVGMRKEWILTEEEKQNKKRRIEENRRLRLNNINETKDLNHSIDKLDVELQSVILNKNQITSLNSKSSIQNGDVMRNVGTAFNDGFQLDPSSYGRLYPLAKKITALCQILNTKNTTALRLISFFKRLVEFDALNEIDKVNLIKNNLPYIFIFHGSLGYDPINDIYHEGIPSNDTLLYGADIREAHGDDIHLRCTLIMRSLQSIVQMDQRIMQLALVIMLFSKGLSSMVNTSEPLLSNTRQVLEAQNFYAEQLWIFMEKAYGTTRTVLTFSTLISKCLFTQLLLRDIQQDIHGKLDPCQIPPIIRTIMHLS